MFPDSSLTPRRECSGARIVLVLVEKVLRCAWSTFDIRCWFPSWLSLILRVVLDQFPRCENNQEQLGIFMPFIECHVSYTTVWLSMLVSLEKEHATKHLTEVDPVAPWHYTDTTDTQDAPPNLIERSREASDSHMRIRSAQINVTGYRVPCIHNTIILHEAGASKRSMSH